MPDTSPAAMPSRLSPSADHEALRVLRAAQAANPKPILLTVVVPPGSDMSALEPLVRCPARLATAEGDCATSLHLRINRTVPMPPRSAGTLPAGTTHALEALAEFCARGRTPIRRGTVPQLHAPFGLLQQLTSLATSSAKLSGQPSIGPDDVAIARRIVLDSIPAHRRLLIDSALRPLTADEQAMLKPVRKRALAELQQVGLADQDALTVLASGLLVTAGVARERAQGSAESVALGPDAREPVQCETRQ